MNDYRFPVLDYDRSGDEYAGNCREVLRETVIEPAIAETGDWVTLPIRSVVDATTGPGFEIGPYTLTESDIAELFNAISAHVSAYPELFRIKRGGDR